MYKGPRPVLLETNSLNDFLLHLVGNENANSGLEFGAQQVIIVRSQESKEKLPKELKQCLVMTVQEVKGLEFEDVFVYNYFTDSPENTNWNAITYYRQQVETNESLDHVPTSFESLQAKVPHNVSFDAEKDRILCSELKMLYMVVTRARQRVYLFDEVKTRVEPIKQFWSSRNLIAVAKTSQELSSLGTILKKSTPSAWVSFHYCFY
jgi:ATP-dependent exoDNAse (exonuclease V) beta subunit